MLRTEKERIVTELEGRLQATESLIVADYRGLSNSELADLRTKLLENGARFTVVKNTLARRAAEAAGADDLLALIDGPTAIAFVDASGNAAAVAKILVDTAGETKVLSVRGGIISGASISDVEIESLAKLPPVDVLKGQLIGAIIAPITGLAALLAAPLNDLVGLIDARIAQLEEQGEGGAEEAPEEEPAEEEPAAEEEPVAEAEGTEPAAEAVTEPEAEAEAPTEAESGAEPTAEADPEPAAEADTTDSTETDSNEEE